MVPRMIPNHLDSRKRWGTLSLDEMLKLLKERQEDLSPLLSQTARYVIDHPGEVGVSSLRDLAV